LVQVLNTVWFLIAGGSFWAVFDFRKFFEEIIRRYALLVKNQRQHCFEMLPLVALQV